jgi:inner membrane protein
MISENVDRNSTTINNASLRNIKFHIHLIEQKEEFMLLAHAPAGYLLTRFLTRTIFKNSIDPKRSDQFYQIIITAGVIGAILPDFDFIYNLFFDSNRTPHHHYITHLPIFWVTLMLLSTIVGMLLKIPKFTITAVTGGASALLHLACDTITGDIYWLYPLSDRGFNIFAVSDVHLWWVQNYLSHWTFLIEIGITFIAMVVFLRVKETVSDLMNLLRQSARLRAILVRFTVCITTVVLIILVGSIRFDIDRRIMKKMIAIKHRVLKTVPSM